MTMIAYAFLQHRHLTQVGRKKESTDRRLSLACRPYATPSSISFFDHYLSNAHTAEDEAVNNSGVGKSAKVVLVWAMSFSKSQRSGGFQRRNVLDLLTEFSLGLMQIVSLLQLVGVSVA